MVWNPFSSSLPYPAPNQLTSPPNACICEPQLGAAEANFGWSSESNSPDVSWLFLTITGSLEQSWSSWAVGKAFVPLKWVGSSLLPFPRSGRDGWKMEQYIHVDTFIEKTDLTVSILQKKMSKNCPMSESLLIPYYDLAELCIDIFPTEEEFELCLLYLQRRKLICVHEMDDKTKIVKFCPGKSGWSWSAPVVSKEELSKIELEKSLKVNSFLKRNCGLACCITLFRRETANHCEYDSFPHSYS